MHELGIFIWTPVLLLTYFWLNSQGKKATTHQLTTVLYPPLKMSYVQVITTCMITTSADEPTLIIAQAPASVLIKVKGH